MAADQICQLKTEIMEFADLIASAALRHQAPAKDEVTFRQAAKEFDRGWLELQIARNRVKGVRTGKCRNSPIKFSRFELMALKEAEKRGAQMVRK